MATESLILEENQISPLERSERADEGMQREAEQTLGSLERSGDIDATQHIVLAAVQNSPAAGAALDTQRQIAADAMISRMQTPRVETTEGNEDVPEVSQDIVAYFSLDQAAMDDLHESLSPLGLVIGQLLESFKNYIESDLADLPEEQKEKIRKSIGIKTGDIGEIVKEMKSESTSEADFRTMRWILNDKIGEAYNFYTKKLFPTIGIYLALAKGESVPEKYHSRKEYFGGPGGGATVEMNPNHVNVNHYMEELTELLDASVDSDGDFDEGLFYTQQLINTESTTHAELAADMGVRDMESISILNEDDRRIEAEVMIYYLCAVGLQCLPYIGGVAGVAADSTDLFSDHDATLSGLQELDLVNQEYRMEKTALDRAFAGLGLVLTAVGLQGLARSKKIANALGKIRDVSRADLSAMIETFAEKRNLGEDITRVLKNFLDDGSSASRIDAPESTNLDAQALQDIVANFTPDEVNRISRAENAEVLGRTLNDEEKVAIIAAHNVGERGVDGKYSFGDLREKIRILREAGISNTETRTLLDKNICGTTLDIDQRIQKLNLSIQTLEDIPGFNNLFDSQRGGIIYENVSNEEILELVNEHDSLKELFNLYRESNGQRSDPDAFRELFTQYNGANSNQYDDIVGKLSKMYYRLQLIELEGAVNPSIRLLGGAPGSGKTTSAVFLDRTYGTEYDLTFDSPLSDIRFIDYLVDETSRVGLDGVRIDIDMIHRDPHLAWEGIITRAIETGRPVGISYYIETYKKVIDVMNTLSQRGNINPRFIDNSGGLTDIAEIDIDTINRVSPPNINRNFLESTVHQHIMRAEDQVMIDTALSAEERDESLAMLRALKTELLR